MANTLWLAGSVTLLLAPPALFGLFCLANETAHNRSPGMDDFFRGARGYLAISYRWGLVNLIVAALLVTNFFLYPQFAGNLTTPVLTITLALAIAWFIVQVYAVPYLLELETPSVRVALRNGLFTALASPIVTLGLGLVIGLIVLVCVVQPIFTMLGAGALIALIANHAVLERLEAFGARPKRVTGDNAEPLMGDFDMEPDEERDAD